MRFGCCAGLATFVPPTLDGQQDSLSVAHAKQCDKIPGVLAALEEAGFDYVEFGVGMTVPEQPEEDFERFLAKVEGSRLQAEVFSSFIPAWIKVVGPDVMRNRIILTYEAEAEEMTTDDIIRKVFENVKVP